MGEEIVSEYDHDILILISTAQKVKAVEKKASSINPHIQTRHCDGKAKLFAFFGKNKYVGLISTDFLYNL